MVEESLRQALDPVLRDLTFSASVCPEVVDEPWADSEQQPSAWLRLPDGYRVAVSVWLPDPAPRRVASLADRVQEGIAEVLWPSGSTWPACPDHPEKHPMATSVLLGRAWWTCPETGAKFAVVGELQ